MPEFSESLAMETLYLFQPEIIATCQVILPTTDDFDLAKYFIENFRTGLRAGDALYLAIAKNRLLPVYTLDSGLVTAANLLNLTTYHSKKLITNN